MTVPYWLLFLAGVCFGVRALFGLAALADRVGGDDPSPRACSGSSPASTPRFAKVGGDDPFISRCSGSSLASVPYDWAKDDAA